MNDDDPNKPALSKYFNDDKTPSAAAFFDEISTSFTQSTASQDTADAGFLVTHRLTEEPVECKLFSNPSSPQEVQNLQPLTDTAIDFMDSSPINMISNQGQTTTNLPDPSTFFDSIGTAQLGEMSTASMDDFLRSTPEEYIPVEPQPSGGEGDRRRDAWIPTEDAKKILIQAQTSATGSFFPDRELLTMPGLVLDEELSDALYEAVCHYLGPAEASQRSVLKSEHFTQDERGIRELIRAGYIRAAIHLTGKLLTAYGQGRGRVGHPTKHSPRSLQLWFTRLALLTRIKAFHLLGQEAEVFDNLDKPDVFFQFYPETYGARSGSMASFSFRLLLAEMPVFFEKTKQSIDRLYGLLGVVRNIINNLKLSLSEDGSPDTNISSQDRQESIKLWSGREARVMHSIVNTALLNKDYPLAMSVVSQLCESPNWPQAHVRSLVSALGRICLQAGHIVGAEANFARATSIRTSLQAEPDVRELVDRGLLAVAQNAFTEAYQCFNKASEVEPVNIMVANNMAVCLLYSGRLKDAIAVLENAVNADPDKALTENLLLNLCTLYELESSNTKSKKLSLLRQLCKYKTDIVPNVVACLKLQDVK